jgi:hypothetical protein
MKFITSIVAAACVLLLNLTASPANPGGYLFVTFRGQQGPMDEQIYFALSKDRRNWTALNDSKPVLVSQLGEKGVRDPYLLRSHDNKKFYLIATDLSWALDRSVPRSIRAGTDPTNAASVFRVSAMSVNGSDVLLDFPTVAGKTYRLERSDSLLNGSWTPVQENIAGNGGTIQLTDTADSLQTKRFYRIVVVP